MSFPYLGEVRLFSYNGGDFSGWLPCDGRTMLIAENQALFSLLGAVYGGDGTTTFCLPDLRGRVLLGMQGLMPGQSGGAETVTLTQAQMPEHDHVMAASGGTGTALSANLGYPAAAAPDPSGATPQLYAAGSPATALAAGSVSSSGGGGPHNNIQPSIVLQYCIATNGMYPPRP